MPSSTSPTQSSESHTAYRTPTKDEIARYAHDIWEQDGRPDGKSLEHWLAAEAALLAPSRNTEEVSPTALPTQPDSEKKRPAPDPKSRARRIQRTMTGNSPRKRRRRAIDD